jgi:hypothetical protein
VFVSDNKEQMPFIGDKKTKYTTQNVTNLTKIWESTNGYTVIKWQKETLVNVA